MREIGTKLKQRRQQLGLTQTEVSSKTGITQARISEIEGGANFEVWTLLTLCKLYGGSVEFLWKEHQEKNTK